jgi:hypothetical protein
LIPPDEVVVPEGLDYVIYFCSPGCHEAWERARADAATRARDERETPREEH